jgi:predicted outer membrane repeat protein
MKSSARNLSRILMTALHGRSRVHRRRAWRFAPRLVPLEVRALLSTITVTNDNDSGDGSLRAAVAAAASGDTIDFARSAYGTITLTSGPIEDVGTSLTIQGPGAALLTVSGNNASGILDFEPADPSLPPFAIGISGLTLADAAGPDTVPSHAITDNYASLTLDGDVITRNQSGGVSVVNALGFGAPPVTITVNVTNSTFLDNQNEDIGGGLAVYGVVLNVSNSLFEGNSSAGPTFAAGGALYLSNTFATNTIATIDNSRFLDNTADDGGGAILSDNGLTITRSTFIGNQSFHSAGGGAIWNAWVIPFFGALTTPSGAFDLSDSTFVDNQAVGTYAFGGSADGGAIAFFNINGPIHISGGSFVNNLAEGVAGSPGVGGWAAGGAIDAFSTAEPPFGPFKPLPFAISGTTFVGNRAIGGNSDGGGGFSQGGAVRLQGFLNATVTGDQFIANSAVGGSGGSGSMYPYFGYLAQSAFGGAIELGADEASISGCAFVGNSAIGGNGGRGQMAGSGEGGAIDHQFTPVTLSDSTFTGNLAQGGNGGAAAAGSSAAGGAGGLGIGGAFANVDFLPYGSTVSLDDVTVTGNRAIGGACGAGDGTGSGGVGGDAMGGAILNAGGLDVSSSKFTADQAIGGEGGPGGATGVGGNGGDGDGGAIFTASFGDPAVSTITVSTSAFMGNLATGGDGGSGSTEGSDGQGLGGAIAILDGSATITKSKFAGNKASTSGDDIYGSYTS